MTQDTPRVSRAPHTRRERLVALFGLSADPPTGRGGHVGIALWCANTLRVDGQRMDEVWVLPVYRHIFASKRELSPYHHRLAMTRLAFANLEGARAPIIISEIERELCEASTAPIGTVDVLTHLRAHHPESRFVLILGADSYRDLCAGRWKDAPAIARLATVVGIARPGLAHDGDLEVVPNLSRISSTLARSTRDPELLATILPPEVFDYVRAHGLYAHGR